MKEWLRAQIPVSSKLSLRVLTTDDAPDYLQLLDECRDGLAIRIPGLATIFTTEDALENIELKAQMFNRQASFSYGILLVGRLVGMVGNGGYHGLHLNPEQSVRLLYFLTPGCQGRGIARCAVGAVIKEIEERTLYRGVLAEIHPHNEGSINLALSLGLEFLYQLSGDNVYGKPLRGYALSDLKELCL